MSDLFDLRRFIFRSRKATAAGLAAVALVAGFVGGRAGTPVAAQTPAAVSEIADPRPMAARQDSYRDVVNRVAPAVVTIRVENRVAATPTGLPNAFREFFGDALPQNRAPRAYRQEGLGSGVTIRADGYILTNHHVVADAERVNVELRDRRSFEAKVVGSDPASDLAVLKIEARDLPTVPFGDSNGVEVGDVVLAIGNPLGVGQTVTMGIVSAKGRATGVGDGSYEDFIQTDAPINQGNSGGALVGLTGELVGINSQILSPSGGNIGLGFAIPSSMARSVSEQLIRDGVVHRSKLGVTVQPMTGDLAASLGLTNVRGALVSGVEAGSPAADAGLRQGDVITQVNERPVLEANAVRNQIASAEPGTTISLTVLRGGQEQRLSARLVERNADHESRQSPQPARTSKSEPRLGMAVQSLTPQLVARMGLPESATGLLVTGVDPAGAAADAGLQPGDLITRVNDVKIRTASDLTNAVEQRGNRPALVLVRREGSNLFVALNPRA